MRDSDFATDDPDLTNREDDLATRALDLTDGDARADPVLSG